ncbi:MAG: alpha-hydroxy-acid oxidizing protein [Acidobacteria bacterium]|nr:alpha-hydroxy-acid oxidizing protein [Acidobacteriota bacterium]
MTEITKTIATCLADFEALARARISHMACEYIAGGAADEHTLRWNREAYDRIRLKPRVLVDVSRLDPRVSLFGRNKEKPGVSPCGDSPGSSFSLEFGFLFDLGLSHLLFGV